MCTGLEPLIGLVGAATSAAGTVASMMQKPPKPPPVPAATPPTTITPEATVKVGQQDSNQSNSNTPGVDGFVTKRSQGKALGGLGRSGLAI